MGERAFIRPFVLLNIRECLPPGVNKGMNNTQRFTAEVQVHLPEANVTPGGQLMLLKTGHWLSFLIK
jgi:hypothetical protein